MPHQVAAETADALPLDWREGGGEASVDSGWGFPEQDFPEEVLA